MHQPTYALHSLIIELLFHFINFISLHITWTSWTTASHIHRGWHRTSMTLKKTWHVQICQTCTKVTMRSSAVSACEWFNASGRYCSPFQNLMYELYCYLFCGHYLLMPTLRPNFQAPRVSMSFMQQSSVRGACEKIFQALQLVIKWYGDKYRGYWFEPTVRELDLCVVTGRCYAPGGFVIASEALL